MKKLKTIQFGHAKDIPKGWGKEVQIINNILGDDEKFPKGYSGKLLVYDKDSKSSMHFHTIKHETFYILHGCITFWYYDPDNADLKSQTLYEGDTVIIPPCNPHQVECKNESVVIEFASADHAWDNYRIDKGDSQKTVTIAGIHAKKGCTCFSCLSNTLNKR